MSDRSSQIYAFLDGGTVPKRGPVPDERWLVSAGGGLRLGLEGPLDLGVEIALPMTASRYDTGDRSPRLNLGIGFGF
jgi:hemolysin activation/secretion protein